MNTRTQYKFRFVWRCAILGYETLQSGRLIPFERTCCLYHQSQVTQAGSRPYDVNTYKNAISFSIELTTFLTNLQADSYKLSQFCFVFFYFFAVIIYTYIYEGGSKIFRPDIQKPRQMENAAKDI